MQSKLWQPDAPQRGNCFGACLATLLDVPLWMVPAFEDMRADLGDERRHEWLARFFRLALTRTEGHAVVESIKGAHYIACGPSPRGAGIYHAVVYRHGALVHDPHPLGGGLLSVAYTYHLEPTR